MELTRCLRAPSCRGWRPLFLLLAIVGCNQERFERYPIEVVALEFADTLQAGQPESIRVGAEVGYVGCELENAGLERRGDSFYVRGNARCRIVEQGPERMLQPQIETPPARPNPQWLRFDLPDLEPGAYIVNGGDLRDTLIVAPISVPPASRRMAGMGQIGWDSSVCSGSAAIFALDLFRLFYEVLDLAPSGVPARVEIHATQAGTATCDSTRFTGALRLRSIAWLKGR